MSEHLRLLVDDIKKKNIVLFLGSGFAYNAIHPDSKKPPLGKELGNLLSDAFLGGNYKDSPLSYISDLAISKSDLFKVQNFIYDTFEKFRPNDNHLKYASLPWKAIFTTNYDLILEEAYKKNDKNNIQQLSVVYRNTPDQQIFKNVNTVPYYKLHGCITHIDDNELPLILSSDQYLTHLKNRQRLFNKFHELAQDYSIVFIGYSNQDHNIRAILLELESLKSARPRSYMISPNFTDLETSYWEERKITPIKRGHEEFINYISDNISENDRVLSTFIRNKNRKIEEKFNITFDSKTPSESLLNLLDLESEYVHSGMPLGNSTPQEFYKGILKNWDPIIRSLDVRRKIEDRILTDIVIEDRYLREKESYLFLLKGFAGSGKTVLLKRLAWECANEFNKCAIYLNSDIVLRIPPIIELYSYLKERIYLFVDNLLENSDQLISLINRAEREEIELTIISTERINQLNGEDRIEGYISNSYKLNYLSDNEVELLIAKLEKHNSLGHLKNKSTQQRKQELAEKTGRVLLVALYEATGGKPFEEIILDEYQRLPSVELREIYLTVAVFHRLNTKIRAGLLSRIHKISFTDFKQRLFRPLEFIVFNEYDYRVNDYIYSTRHPYIAQIIFELVLTDQQERYDEYIRILNNLDIDFRSDWIAFLDIISARNLNEIFNDPIRIKNIYDLADKLNPEDPRLIQQRGIFQMISKSGSLVLSDKYLKEAHSLDPEDIRISHSLAELSLKRAEVSQVKLETKQHLDISQKLCREILKKSKSHAFSYHTLLKIDLYNFKESISEESENLIQKNIKSFEKTLFESKQLFPFEPFILDTEAKFNELINQKPNAVDILKKAYEVNKASPFIAIRYSKLLNETQNTSEAIEALKSTLELNPNDKKVSYYLAKFIEKASPQNFEEISHYFRRSFTKGDTNYDAQFWYARSLYLNGDKELASEFFEKLGKSRLAPKVKNKTAGVILNNSRKADLFKGTIITLESNFGFVRVEKFGNDIFMYRDKDNEYWPNFKINSKLEFNIAFNYKGPIVINPKLI